MAALPHRPNMTKLVHDLILHTAKRMPAAEALGDRQRAWTYTELSELIEAVARGLLHLGLAAGERVAVYLPKRLETVAGLFGTSCAGGVFVPVNPLLKPEQVAYILADCNVRVLITSTDRADLLAEALSGCHDLRAVVLIDGDRAQSQPAPAAREIVHWDELCGASSARKPHRRIDIDMAAILYTSGSTGKPKGVVLSHRNIVTGAESVAHYLENTAEDRILSLLPLSFDYGLSQLTTAFHVGACAVLFEYLVPRDVVNAVAKDRITGLAAVPPLWIQLAQIPWPGDAQRSLRYLTNSGGRMPRATLEALRRALPHTRPYLMYGLTEAFRSTYLPPEEVDRRPDSIGKAIPNAEVMVVREDGSPCAPGEPGELVHRGPLVSLGYWNDPEKTAERFRPAPGRDPRLPLPEIAVWSGDTVKSDADGFLYFIGRRDDMIKTSGYRVSPTEIEEVAYATGLVGQAAALGVPHPVLGQAIVLVATPPEGATALDRESLVAECKRRLPAFMVPLHIEIREALPRNPNGKIDRRSLTQPLQGLFEGILT
jgi:acyl-CoA ligase (AMP-forming) (exosortase A-associated)